AAMARQEHHLERLAVPERQFAEMKFVGGLAPRTFDALPALVLQPGKFVDAAAADHAENRLRQWNLLLPHHRHDPPILISKEGGSSTSSLATKSKTWMARTSRAMTVKCTRDRYNKTARLHHKKGPPKRPFDRHNPDT